MPSTSLTAVPCRAARGGVRLAGPPGFSCPTRRNCGFRANSGRNWLLAWDLSDHRNRRRFRRQRGPGSAKIVERVIHSAERHFDGAGMLRSPPEARFHITRLLLTSAYAHQLCVLEPTYPARTLSSRRPSMWARSAPAAPWCYRIWYGRPGGHPAESEAGPYD